MSDILAAKLFLSRFSFSPLLFLGRIPDRSFVLSIGTT